MAATRTLRFWLTSAMALLLCYDVIEAAYDRSVCDQAAFKRLATSNPGPAKPPLAAAYSVRVEANLLQLNRTLDAEEFYDFNSDRGAVVQWDRGVESRVIFDGNTDQLITVTMPDYANPQQHFTRCEVNPLSTSNNSFVFGSRRSANGTEQVFNIGDSFRMAVSQPDVYLGTLLTESGMWVEGWQSCLYMDNLDATFNATWYFTANNTWTTSLGYGAPQAPVSLRITGSVAGAHAHDFDHVYSFSEYRPQSDQTQANPAFQTPAGVYCPGQASTRPLPNITNNFSFRTEIVDTGTQFINHMAEYYYYEMRVVRYEYQAMRGSVYGTNPLSRIHDFNTGVAYTIDKVRGNCSVSSIQQLGFVGESQDSAFVVMRTAQQFFDLQRHRYVYTGQRTVRDIECDVWIAVRDDWPPKQPFETKWEWYFATPAWIESVGYQYEIQLPVLLRVTADDFDPPFERIFNIFDYREGQNKPWDFDVSPCFAPYSHRKEYTLTIPGNYSQLVATNRSNFVYFFILAVTAHAQVSFMRVANVQLEHDASNIYASFSLLDQAPLPGDLSVTPPPELSLAQAADKMEDDIVSGTFSIRLVLSSDSIQTLVVSGYKFNSQGPGYHAPPGSRDRRAARGFGAGAPTTPAPGTTYTTGAMAGLGVAMTVTGYGMGLGLTLLGHRLYGGRRTEMENPLTEFHSGPRF